VAETGDFGRRIHRALQPGIRFIVLYPLVAMACAMLLGVSLWGGFNWSMEATNTQDFCISCHVMRDNVYKEYRNTVHFENRTGVRASCPDCHVPKEWTHKLVRKIRASNELFHWLKGTISTREKFEARRPVLARHVWQSMKESDSRECRNCHGIGFMKLKAQSATASKMHELATKWEMTCIDCHKGIAHSIPSDHNAELAMDQLHDRFKAEKVNCRDCHTGMAAPSPGDEW
jgi:cytochrome c-type protein NapC